MKLEYLDEFSELDYEIKGDPDRVELTNLKNMSGADVAELLTYLYDDGYGHFGALDVLRHDTGFLMMVKSE